MLRCGVATTPDREGALGRLEGQCAIVTGASRGIGLAIATAFAQQGATVVVSSRRADGVAAAADQIRGAVPGATVDGRVLHVGQLDRIEAFYDEVQRTHGTPSILVNNAGTNPYFGPMMGLEWPAWDKTFEVNLKGPFAMIRGLVTRHLADPRGAGASVISVASILGITGSPLQGIYGMTKAAIMSMTRTLAVELGPAGIRVNAIAPGLVDTKLAAAITTNPSLLDTMVARTPLGRIAQPDEIAGLAVYLASDEASFVTGQTYTIDGGLTVR